MEILPKRPTEKGPPDRFIGDVWMDIIVRGDPPSRIRAAIVRFAPGARSAWHRHAAGQTLYVTEGTGRTQARGGAVTEIRPGDVIRTPPGEWHWHGAAPNRFMTHLTVYEAPADGGEESDWDGHVDDDAYLAPPANGGRA